MRINAEEIKKMARKVPESLSSLGVDISDPKKRFEKILQKSQDKKETISYLSLRSHRLYGDFVVIVEKNNKYDFVGVKIGESKEEVEWIQKKQSEARMKLKLNGRKFIEKLVILVDRLETDEELEKNWEKTIRQFKES
ncbi:MAG: hypothetical protein ABIF84_02625 [Patescibacteria group bacterium]